MWITCTIHDINNVDYMYNMKYEQCGLHVQYKILTMDYMYNIEY
jgi:hypothetical protein